MGRLKWISLEYRKGSWDAFIRYYSTSLYIITRVFCPPLSSMHPFMHSSRPPKRQTRSHAIHIHIPYPYYIISYIRSPAHSFLPSLPSPLLLQSLLKHPKTHNSPFPPTAADPDPAPPNTAVTTSTTALVPAPTPVLELTPAATAAALAPSSP